MDISVYDDIDMSIKSEVIDIKPGYSGEDIWVYVNNYTDDIKGEVAVKANKGVVIRTYNPDTQQYEILEELQWI